MVGRRRVRQVGAHLPVLLLRLLLVVRRRLVMLLRLVLHRLLLNRRWLVLHGLLMRRRLLVHGRALHLRLLEEVLHRRCHPRLRRTPLRTLQPQPAISAFAATCTNSQEALGPRRGGYLRGEERVAGEGWLA